MSLILTFSPSRGLSPTCTGGRRLPGGGLCWWSPNCPSVWSAIAEAARYLVRTRPFMVPDVAAPPHNN